MKLTKPQRDFINKEDSNRILVFKMRDIFYYFSARTANEIEKAGKYILTKLYTFKRYDKPEITEFNLEQLNLEQLPERLQVRIRQEINYSKKRLDAWEDRETLVAELEKEQPCYIALLYFAEYTEGLTFNFDYLFTGETLE